MAFNRHPPKLGLNHRTDLYYVETRDHGRTWVTADGKPVTLPLTDGEHFSRVYPFEKEGLKVYLKDLTFDHEGRPVILVLTSKGWAPGPKNGPFRWRTARWTGEAWEILPAMDSDNNYDMGTLRIEKDGAWRIVAPTGRGPQPFNTGGEVECWESRDQGKTWTKVKALTGKSEFNHTYARRPVDAHPDFYAFWADGHGREPSRSRLYFCDREGKVFRLPEKMEGETAKPVRVFE